MKIFPESWRVLAADAVCSEIIDCVNKTAPVVNGPTPYKMIRTTNVRNGRINVDDCRYVDEVTFIKWTRRVKPKRNDIVLTREAPLGEVGLIRSDENVFLGQRTMLYRADLRKLDQRFLYYSLIGPYVQAQIRGQGNGSTVEHLRVPDAETLKIPIAPLPDQKKIAAILSAYDDLIENNQRRIVLLEKMAEELYREWFVRLRFPGHEQVKLHGGIPDGWKAIKFSEICEFEKGKNPEITYNSKVDGAIPYINIDTLERGVNTYTIPEKNSVHSSDNDILMLMDGARSGLVFRGCEGVVGSTLALIRVSDDLRGIIFEYLKTGNEQIVFNNTGSAIPHANKEFIKRMILFIPDDSSLIRKFNSIYKEILDQKKMLLRKNSILAATKELLLHRLISGKLSVEQLDIQFPPSMQEAAA